MVTAFQPIGVLDSGLGGLTVLSAIRKLLPAEDLIYFGDTARLPYGNKSPETVTQFVREILRYLQRWQPKHVVIACNTATALTLPALAAEFPELSLSGVIEPGARAAITAAGTKRSPIIGIIGTEATIRSKAYDRAILRRRNLAHLLLRPTPLLVPMIEEGRTSDDPIVESVLRQYLQGMLMRNVDVLVLGCTHYPIIKRAIAKVAGPKIRLIDSAEQCAQDVARRLKHKHLLRPQEILIGQASVGDDGKTVMTASPKQTGTLRSFVTDDAARFATLASRFLKFSIEAPMPVMPDELYSLKNSQPMRLRVSA